VIDEKLIIGCKNMHRDAQRKVYKQMSSKLYRTCKRYLKNEEEAQEALADAFYTILTKINMIKENGAFEAWARRITVNQCLAYIKKKPLMLANLADVNEYDQPFTDAETDLEEEELLNLLNHIPEGCKTIFNLFVIEGYSHKEIAFMLNISEGTSKSQLNAAKTKLKELVNNLYYLKSK
jgi:RNA polymerase sigma factor (sigma-70 family)